MMEESKGSLGCGMDRHFPGIVEYVLRMSVDVHGA